MRSSIKTKMKNCKSKISPLKNNEVHTLRLKTSSRLKVALSSINLYVWTKLYLLIDRIYIGGEARKLEREGKKKKKKEKEV
jgi:hypothetical protein